MEHRSSQIRISRLLHVLGEFTARSGTAAVALGVVLAFGLIIGIYGIRSIWEGIFSTIVSAVVLVMLFVIQHTQNRHQVAIQLKLDELIRSSPRADDLLVHIEAADDGELIERELDQLAHHAALRDSEIDGDDGGI
ncbi:MAG: low affinity iron permease family protein [Actinomycetota bacterium]